MTYKQMVQLRDILTQLMTALSGRWENEIRFDIEEWCGGIKIIIKLKGA